MMGGDQPVADPWGEEPEAGRHAAGRGGDIAVDLQQVKHIVQINSAVKASIERMFEKHRNVLPVKPKNIPAC